jgi:GAF domain-containing protein
MPERSEPRPGALPDAPGFRIPDDPAELRIEQIARVSAELSAATTMDAVVAAAVDHAAVALGAAVSTLMLTEGDRLRLLAGHGLRAGVQESWETFGLDDVNPASLAARTGRPVVLADVETVEREYPVLRSQMPAGRSLVCVPLDNTSPAVGVIGLTFEQGWTPGEAELALLTVFAEACGQAVRRVLASEEAAKRDWELAFLAGVSLELSSSLDYESTLANVANLCVPQLADWCAVDIVTAGVPSTLAVAHLDPEKVRWAWELQERYPTDYESATGAANVYRTGRSEFYPAITDEMLVAGARDEEHLRLSRELNLRGAMVVPIPGRDVTLGVLSLLRTDDSPPYAHNDLVLAEEVGRRAGVAIENARLYGQTQDVALQLQRAVLPDGVDKIPYWEVAAHYAPGGRVGVGGDFYDAVPLPNGSLALAIGDVMGHGVPAAAAMAQIRSATRAFLSLDPDPATVVANLDTMFARLAITQLVTMFYAVADLAAGTVSFTNAGHYPALVISVDDEPRSLATPPRLPLGAGGDERTTTTVPFGGSDVLVLFTDGLVERRGEIVDLGVSRLTQAAPGLLAGPLADGMTALVGTLIGDDADDATCADNDDDVTVLTVRRRVVL